MSASNNAPDALSFGSVAERYERVRASYPAALLDEVTSRGPGIAVDVGCGTGKVAAALQDRGWRVVGVEPDSRMAAVASRRGVVTEVTTFEQWDSKGRRFDLLVSGTAWHWVDPVHGAAKAVEVIRPGGRLALFWNVKRYPGEVMAALESAYQRYQPQLLDSSIALGMGFEPMSEPKAAAALRGTSGIERVSLASYEWRRTYTPSLWADEVSTHSSHIALGEALLPLLDAATKALEPLGPTFEAMYRTLTVFANRSCDRA